MGPFTFVPLWLLQDVVLLASAIAVFAQIILRERRRLAPALEIAAFTFLYAGVYENISSVVGWYEWGRSLIMFFNVPLAVALYEAIVCYVAIRLLERMRVPTWLVPIGAGFFAVVQDFALDPVATHLWASTEEGASAHWTFRIPMDGAEIYGEPVMNFASWMWLVGVAAAFIVLGRWWYRRSGYRTWVAIAYPLLACIASLAVLFSPLSRIVLFGQVGYGEGEWTTWPPVSTAQWWILAAMLVLPPLLFAVFWRGDFKERVSIREDKSVVFALVGVPLCNVVIGMLGGLWGVLWLPVVATALMAIMVLGIYALAARANRAAEARPEAVRA